VLDPFMGSGTTLKVAVQLGRNAVGYDIDVELLETVKEKLGINRNGLSCGSFDIAIRSDATHLRAQLRWKVEASRRRYATGLMRAKEENSPRHPSSRTTTW